MNPVVKTSVNYQSHNQSPRTYIDRDLAQKTLKMTMIRAILVEAGCSKPIMDKDDIMDILHDNDMHPQTVSFCEFLRLRTSYVELGVLNRISNVK